MYIVSRSIRPCQEYHLESVVSFVGWGGMIFASSKQLSGSAPQAISRRQSVDVAVWLSPAKLDLICLYWTQDELNALRVSPGGNLDRCTKDLTIEGDVKYCVKHVLITDGLIEYHI